MILWAILILLVLGYLAGTWLNRRRSNAIGHWIEEGIRPLGGKATWIWLRSVSAGGQVTITNAQQPFSQIEISFVFLTRELPPLWAVELIRGKQDMLVVRANLRDQPVQAFEVLPREGELRKTLDAHSLGQPWNWQDGPSDLGIATRGDQNKRWMAGLRGFLEQFGPHLQRVSLRERQPNLIIFLQLTGQEAQPPREFFQALRKLARSP